MAQAPASAQGFLVIRVEEAQGKTQDQALAWDNSNAEPFQAFVKIELRGAGSSVKVQTQRAPLEGSTLNFAQELHLTVPEDATELRIMLCRDKVVNGKRGATVVAACGIFLEDIISASPVKDKYFELFKPLGGGEGGFVRLSLTLVKSLTELQSGNGLTATGNGHTDALAGPKGAARTSTGKRSAGPVKKLARALLWLTVLGAAGAGAVTLAQRKRAQKKEPEPVLLAPPPPPPAKKGLFW